jgi:hypothetical protein
MHSPTDVRVRISRICAALRPKHALSTAGTAEIDHVQKVGPSDWCTCNLVVHVVVQAAFGDLILHTRPVYAERSELSSSIL